MGTSPSPRADRSLPRLDRQDPDLRILCATIFVRDQDKSVRFYVEQLGFSLVVDSKLPDGRRWIAVAPPDGTATLALVTPAPGSVECEQIGRVRNVVLVTEDVAAKYRDWSARGVRFHTPPFTPEWGGTFTSFEDPDGNHFALAGRDEFVRDLEAQRRNIEERLESERCAAQELEIAKQVQARLFPQSLPPLRTLDYAGLCLQAREVGGDYYDFLDLGGRRLGMVLGDISGKGIAAALLMANLQANLRSQYALALDHPQRFLQSVNRCFTKTRSTASMPVSSSPSMTTKRSAFAMPTADTFPLCSCAPITVSSVWSQPVPSSVCSRIGTARSESAGSFPVTPWLYTDGISGAINEAGEEFGEERLIDALRRHSHEPAQALIASILEEVRLFSEREQRDDITLVVSRCTRTSAP